MKGILLFSICFLFLLFTGCSDKDDPKPSGIASQYEDGIFVTNEGNFGEADGSLSFISAEGIVTNDIYGATNHGSALGDVVQSSIVADSLLFIVVNNSNKVEVVNLNDSLRLAYTVTGVSLPRYMAVEGVKGYLSEWVTTPWSEQPEKGQLTIFNVQTGNIEKSIETDFGPERVVIAGDKIFVSNNYSNTVSIIGLESEELIQNLEVGDSPAGMILDVEGDVWVLCPGSYDGDFNPNNDGKLLEISVEDETVKKEIALGINTANELQFNHTKSTLYYYSGTSVYALKTSATEAPEEELLRDESTFGFYGMGVSKSGKIYMADAKDFVQNGEVYVYSSTGEFETKYSVGRIPNGFSFN